MNKDLITNIVLLVTATILILIYAIFVIIDERKKWKKREFFKYTLYYKDDYFLYIDMVKKMKRIIFKKRLELISLSILVFLRRVFIWNKK